MNAVSISQNNLGYIIRQTLQGESLGVVILKRIQELAQKSSGSANLLNAIENQITDEMRHVKIYREMLLSGRFGHQHQLDRAWDKTLTILTQANIPLHILAIGVYGCIEPFNFEVVESLLLPQLSKSDFLIIKDVSADEKKHIDILDLFDDLFSKKLKNDELVEAQKYTSDFCRTFLGGMSLPSGDSLTWSPDSKRNFLAHFRKLKNRIAHWT